MWMSTSLTRPGRGSWINSVITAVLFFFIMALSWQASAQVEQPSIQQCLDSHAESQVLQRNQQLLAARDKVLVCSQSTCPGVVRQECLEWYPAIEKAIPSVVVTVRADGADVVEARLLVDGETVSEKLDGHAREIDPGAHEFRVEYAEREPLIKNVVIVSGDKGRVVAFEFPSTKKDEPVAEVSASGEAVPVQTYRPTPKGVWILGGTAVGLAAGGGVFGALALAAKAKKQDSCAPSCAPADVSSVRSKAIVADVLFGMSTASAVAAFVVYLTRPRVEMPSQSAGEQGRSSKTPQVSAWVGGQQGGLIIEGSF